MAGEPGLTVDRLRVLANEPAETLAQVAAVLAALCGNAEQVQWAAEALENCGTPAGDALTAIAPLTGHDDELVASWACKLLARSGVAARWTEPLLVNALTAQRPEGVREQAARALGQIGATSVAAREALAAAALDGGPRLKRLATASLGG